MALVENRYCLHHGYSNHMNGKCGVCSHEEHEQKLEEQEMREAHNLAEFKSLTVEGKLNWLFTYLTGIKVE